MRMRILIAPSGFKESLGADDVAACMTAGVRRAVPDALVRKAPVPDGGEGFARALVAARGGTMHTVRVTGPVGDPVDAELGMLASDADGPRTAVLEMAAAAGLRLVPRDRRDPLATTTRGVGELVSAALDLGAERVLVGCGDSGTNDGGAGLGQALGARLLDADGHDLPPGGGELHRLAHVDASGLDPRLERTQVEVACNWSNVLTGPGGVARVFGPQKGADEATVERLAEGLDVWADVLERDLGVDVATAPGTGASGGLGAGLVAFCGATLFPRFEIVSRYLDLDAMISGTDLVITAEGAIDRQSARGKVPAEIARRASDQDIPVIALAGTVGEGVQAALDAGLDGYASILTRPCSIEEALAEVRESLVSSAEQTMRLLLAGRRMAAGRPGRSAAEPSPAPGEGWPGHALLAAAVATPHAAR